MTTVAQESSSVMPFLMKWTPRAAFALVGGVYGLGIAYETGLMALIDRVAIYVIKRFFGYVGVGALMPTIQWHAAWLARSTIGGCAAFTYDLTERGSVYVYQKYR